MLRERGQRGAMRRWRSREPFLAAVTLVLVAMMTAFLTLILEQPVANLPNKKAHDSVKIEEPRSLCIENATAHAKYDVVVLTEPRQHQSHQLCRLLKQLNLNTYPQRIYIAFGGRDVEEARKNLLGCSPNAPTGVYFLPESLFQAMSLYNRDLDVGIANFYQALAAMDCLRPTVILYDHFEIPVNFHDTVTGAIQAAAHDTYKRQLNQSSTESRPSRDLGFVISLESESALISSESGSRASESMMDKNCIPLQVTPWPWNSAAFVLSAKHALIVEMKNYLFARGIRDKYLGNVSDLILDYLSLDPFLRDLRKGPNIYQGLSKDGRDGAASSNAIQRPEGENNYVGSKASLSRGLGAIEFRASIIPPIAQPDNPCRQSQVTPLEGLKGHIEKWITFKRSAEQIYFQNPSRVLIAKLLISQIYSGYKKLGCTSVELRIPITPDALRQFEDTIIKKPLDQLIKGKLKRFKPESILQIGCGLGWSGAILRSFYPSTKFVCIDLDVNEDFASILKPNLASILGQPVHILTPSTLPSRIIQNSTSTVLDLDRLAQELGIKSYEIEKFGLLQLNFWSLYMTAFGFQAKIEREDLARLAELALNVISENTWALRCEIISIMGLALFYDNDFQEVLEPLIPVLKEASFEVFATEYGNGDHQLFVKRSPFRYLAREL